jgi:hypothetical protein
MKNRIFTLLIFLLFTITMVSAQNDQKNNDQLGKWKFEAPYAPEGYTTGIIEVGLNENKYSASISFTGNDYKIPAEKIKVEGDTLLFVVFIQDSEITINLKMDGNSKMSGKAIYSEGEIPLTLTRYVPAL